MLSLSRNNKIEFSNSSLIHAALTQPLTCRASYSGQVDEFRNPMKNKLKTQPCLKPVFETISNRDANYRLKIEKNFVIWEFVICVL